MNNLLAIKEPFQHLCTKLTNNGILSSEGGFDMDNTVGILKNVVYNVEKVIIGKRYAIELIINALLCRGHILVEDVPGVGKTSLVSALAKSLDCSFRRVQFTPDIMPSDITGFSAFNPKSGDFEYKPGAVMSQFILADEINRTSAKTQSSLLEVMEENQVTVDGHTYFVPQPFMVLATQNPVEYLGTYQLPEAQLDRFFMKISLGYPTAAEEAKMLGRFRTENPLKTLASVASGEEIIAAQQKAETVHVDQEIYKYIVSLVSFTREQPEVLLGASPRASLCLFKSVQAWAMYNERDFVTPDDVIGLVPHILEHRIKMHQEAKLKKLTAIDIINRALSTVKAPVI